VLGDNVPPRHGAEPVGCRGSDYREVWSSLAVDPSANRSVVLVGVVKRQTLSALTLHRQRRTLHPLIRASGVDPDPE
jgi:hypothetical protein